MLAGADEFRLTDVGHQPDLRASAATSRSTRSTRSAAPASARSTPTPGTASPSRAVYRAPWGINVSGMYRYRSALPYTVYTTNDLNGDGFRFDLLPGGSVNTERGDSFSQLDLRLSKEFTFGPVGLELIAEMFNVFNEENPAAHTLIFDDAGNPIGATPTVYAGDPLQGEQRLTQLGLRVSF